MKVTPIGKKFGKYKPGDVFVLPDRTARVLVKVGKLQEVTEPAPVAAPVYQTRMLQAAPAAPVVEVQAVVEKTEQKVEPEKAPEAPKKAPAKKAPAKKAVAKKATKKAATKRVTKANG